MPLSHLTKHAGMENRPRDTISHSSLGVGGIGMDSRRKNQNQNQAVFQRAALHVDQFKKGGSIVSTLRYIQWKPHQCTPMLSVTLLRAIGVWSTLRAAEETEFTMWAVAASKISGAIQNSILRSSHYKAFIGMNPGEKRSAFCCSDNFFDLNPIPAS